MKFDRLYYFESAARHESFTLAAKEYHIAPSAISQQIKILVKSLGFSLFNRTSNKKVVLTNAGAVFYKRTKEILSLYNDAVEEAKLELSPKINTLTIGISESVPLFSLNKIIYKVKNKYPDIEIKLLQVESNHCKSPLIDGTYDILFTNQVLKLEEEDNLDKKAIKELIETRRQKRLLSQPLEYPSAGSVFRNPPDNFAGKLVEDCGLKGLIKGGAMISDKHANFIINYKDATSDDVKYLIDLAHDKVLEEYGIDLKVEQEFVNWD